MGLGSGGACWVAGQRLLAGQAAALVQRAAGSPAPVYSHANAPSLVLTHTAPCNNARSAHTASSPLPCAAVLTVVSTLLLAFAGFVVQQVPPYWSWMGDISFCTYAYKWV